MTMTAFAGAEPSIPVVVPNRPPRARRKTPHGEDLTGASPDEKPAATVSGSVAGAGASLEGTLGPEAETQETNVASDPADVATSSKGASNGVAPQRFLCGNAKCRRSLSPHLVPRGMHFGCVGRRRASGKAMDRS